MNMNWTKKVDYAWHLHWCCIDGKVLVWNHETGNQLTWTPLKWSFQTHREKEEIECLAHVYKNMHSPIYAKHTSIGYWTPYFVYWYILVVFQSMKQMNTNRYVPKMCYSSILYLFSFFCGRKKKISFRTKKKLIEAFYLNLVNLYQYLHIKCIHFSCCFCFG